MSTLNLDEELSPLGRQALQASADGDVERALQLFNAALAEQPQSPLLHHLLAAELAQRGDAARAEAEFASTVLLAPSLHIARFQLGLLQFTSARVELALLTWQPLLELGAGHALCRFVRAFAALAGERFDDAMQELAAGLEMNTDNAPLNADMREMMRRMEGLRQAPPMRAPGDPAEAPADLDGAHILLSNYHNQSRH